MKSAEELLAAKLNITPLEFALNQFQIWVEASEALAQNKSYEITSGAGAGRKLTRANANEVMKMYNHWKAEVERIENGVSSLAPKFNTVQTARGVR